MFSHGRRVVDVVHVIRTGPFAQVDTRYVGNVAIEWGSDTDQAAWWTNRLHPFAQDVGSLVPDTFDAYARIFHPVDSEPTLRWSDIALLTGRVVHPEMQFDPITKMADGTGPLSIGPPPEGTLTRAGLQNLARILAEHTSTPQSCWFAIWDGYGQLHGGESAVTTMFLHEQWSDVVSVTHEQSAPLLDEFTLDGPRVRVPGREYYLASGALSDVDDFYVQVGRQSPNVWWPTDRSWIVATEIDFTWTYLAGDRATIDAVLNDPDIEALETRTDHAVTFDGDSVNS